MEKSCKQPKHVKVRLKFVFFFVMVDWDVVNKSMNVDWSYNLQGKDEKFPIFFNKVYK
jgi:hypothetical protein